MEQSFETTERIHKSVRNNLVNWNILLTKGQKTKRDFPSSGERKGKSLNREFGVVGLKFNFYKLNKKQLKPVPKMVKVQFCLKNEKY